MTSLNNAFPLWNEFRKIPLQFAFNPLEEASAAYIAENFTLPSSIFNLLDDESKANYTKGCKQIVTNIRTYDDNFIDAGVILDAQMTTAQELQELCIRFFLNLLVCWIIVHFFYYRKSRRRDYYFTFMVFSSAMLMLLYMMGNVEVGVGLTLGLFAIFGVIRYRTETVPIREMTYLFVIIALAAMNGLAPVFNIQGAMGPHPAYALAYGNVGVMALANALVILLIWILESERLVKHTSTKLVLYDRIDLIVPERRAELIEDLEKRVGVKVDSLEIGHVDFLRDAAYIKIYYTLGKGESNSIDTLTRAKDFVQ